MKHHSSSVDHTNEHVGGGGRSAVSSSVFSKGKHAPRVSESHHREVLSSYQALPKANVTSTSSLSLRKAPFFLKTFFHMGISMEKLSKNCAVYDSESKKSSFQRFYHFLSTVVNL